MHEVLDSHKLEKYVLQDVIKVHSSVMLTSHIYML